MKRHTYKISAAVWLYPGDSAAWHFVTLPKKTGAEIKHTHIKPKRGWGSIPVEITLGKTTWRTSIFPDASSGSYVLPLKAGVRKSEGIFEGDKITFKLVLTS